MTNPLQVLLWWEDRHGGLSDKSRRVFLGRQEVGELCKFSESLLKGVISESKKLDDILRLATAAGNESSSAPGGATPSCAIRTSTGVGPDAIGPVDSATEVIPDAVRSPAAWRSATQLPRGAEVRESHMTPESKSEAAHERRRQPSPPEALLWKRLENRQLDGFLFVRERRIMGWWADFYCDAGRLVVEVDGREHRGRLAEDNRRDEVMRANHYRVLRLPAALVFKDVEEAARRVAGALDTPWAASRKYSPPERWSEEAVATTAEEVVDLETPPELSALRGRPEKRRFHCGACNHQFSVDINSGWIECRRCLNRKLLRPVCFGCRKVVEKVVNEGWRCRQCQDIRDVASRAAGSGETPTGPLRDRPSRAHRIRPGS